MHPFEANSSKKSHGLQLMCSGQFPIEPTSPSVHFRPRFRALALFGRRPLQRPHTLVMPATENLHMIGSRRFSFEHFVGAHQERFIRIISSPQRENSAGLVALARLMLGRC